jgi:putative transposase
VADETSFSHVTSRGNGRMTIFRDEVDYLSFLRMLAQVVPDEAWLCHAYCLMPNHVHLLLEVPPNGLAHGMQRLNGRYARRFNERHGRSGHVFEGPYNAEPVMRDEHLLEASRYIVLNPVRARLCEEAASWPWSSYRATAGLGDSQSWLELSLVRELAGGAEGYRRFVAAGAERLQPA